MTDLKRIEIRPPRLSSSTSTSAIERVVLSNAGCAILELYHDGQDIVLGLPDAQDYLTSKNAPYFGVIVGRVANRIARGTFVLNDRSYSLAVNNGPNALHGGLLGWDKQIWHVEHVSESDVTFVRTSIDGEEGFPGAVEARVTYRLTSQGALVVEMRATTNAPTPVNMAQHTYWQLDGHDAPDASILAHELELPNATHYTPTDDTLIPTGAILPVIGTPFDFTTRHVIGERIAPLQATAAKGYDHNYVLHARGADAARLCDASSLAATTQPALIAKLHAPKSRRTLELETTAPGVQLYTAQWLDQVDGKGGCVYGPFAGVCLETQCFPDAINRQDGVSSSSSSSSLPFPPVVLHPGDEYRHDMVIRVKREE